MESDTLKYLEEHIGEMLNFMLCKLYHNFEIYTMFKDLIINTTLLSQIKKYVGEYFYKLGLEKDSLNKTQKQQTV